MRPPRVDQVNVVVDDTDAAAGFLGALGVDVPGTTPDWRAHHRNVPSSASTHHGHGAAEPTFGVDLDSGAFAERWGGLPPGFTGVVLNLRVDERSDVDRVHGRAVSAGGRSLKPPYDAFWGARYAVVEGPGRLVVGLMSPPDPARRRPPPDPSTLGSDAGAAQPDRP